VDNIDEMLSKNISFSLYLNSAIKKFSKSASV
jgi:hypothetical protein